MSKIRPEARIGRLRNMLGQVASALAAALVVLAIAVGIEFAYGTDGRIAARAGQPTPAAPTAAPSVSALAPTAARAPSPSLGAPTPLPTQPALVPVVAPAIPPQLLALLMRYIDATSASDPAGYSSPGPSPQPTGSPTPSATSSPTPPPTTPTPLPITPTPPPPNIVPITPGPGPYEVVPPALQPAPPIAPESDGNRLTFTCTFPLVGAQDITIDFGSVDSYRLFDNQAQPGSFNVGITLNGTMVDGLNTVLATALHATLYLAADVQLEGQTSQPTTFLLHSGDVAVPVSGAMAFGALGVTPVWGGGEVSFTPAMTSKLAIALYMSDGNPVPSGAGGIDVSSVSCELKGPATAIRL